MEYILATVNWQDILLVGSALGIFQGTKMIHGAIKSKGEKVEPTNGNGKYSQLLCDEKHKNINIRQNEIKGEMGELKKDMRDGFKVVFEKLDRIQEHLK